MAVATKTHLTTTQTEQIARAIAEPSRYAILQQIAGAEEFIACAALKVELSPATVSHHLKELAEAGLIDAAREGRCSHLSFRRDTWNAYLAQLSTL